MSAGPWDDGLWDSVALVEAQLRDDTIGIACLLRQGNPFTHAVVLSKMVSEIVKEQDVSLPHFREWAESATARP